MWDFGTAGGDMGHHYSEYPPESWFPGHEYHPTPFSHNFIHFAKELQHSTGLMVSSGGRIPADAERFTQEEYDRIVSCGA